MNKILAVIAVSSIGLFGFGRTTSSGMEYNESVNQQPTLICEAPESFMIVEPEITIIPELPETVIVDVEPEPMLSNSEIELIALVTMAEAEGESIEGQRLVIDTILNRVDSNRFPNTVHGVIYQKDQFTSMWNGRVNRCEVRENICQLVREELDHRTNSEVIFFCSTGYSRYGVPMFRVGNHYFSSY